MPFLVRAFHVSFSLLFINPAFSADVVNGYIDLSAHNFSTERTVRLDGQWQFYWGKLLSPDTVAMTQPDGLIIVPGNWFSYNESAGIFDKAYGIGTYVLRLTLPAGNEEYALKLPNIQTAYRLFVNGKEFASRGATGTNGTTSIPNAQTAVALIRHHDNEPITIVIQVSNFHFPSTSGIWASPEIGPLENIILEKTMRYLVSSFLIGSLFIMGLYHVALYLMRRKDTSALYFSIICFGLAVRELFSGEVIIFDIFPELSWVTGLRLLILCFPVSFYFFTAFLWRLYPELFYKPLLNAVLVVSSVFAGSVLVFSAAVYMQLMLVFNLLSTFLSVYVIIRLVHALRRKMEGSELFIFGYLILIAASISDALVQAALINGTYILPIAFFIFVLCQAMVLAIRFTKSFGRVEELSEDLIQTNASYARFVPKEFSKFLNRTDITHVQLGDAMEAEMTVLFADIKGFSTLAEKMSPQATFQFINGALGKTGPLIRKHDGFIDKYLGDGIMAIFPSKPDDAILAAIEVQKALKDEGSTFQYGIGIHTGKLVLGIIGEPERIESTVISDTVNVASRVEGLTRKYDANIIITEDSYKRISDLSKFNITYIDTTPVKGRDEPARIYGVRAADNN